MNDEAELAAFSEWERESWELRAQAYAASLGDLTRGSVAALLDSAVVGAGSRVLDVGTGPGFVALEAAARGAVVRAVDQSAEMVRIARAAGVDAEQASALALPYDDGSFDAVVAGYLLNHVAQPELAIAEMGRVLTRRGRVALSIWDVHESNRAVGLIASVCAEFGLVADVPAGPDAYRFTVTGEVDALLSECDEVTVSRRQWTVVVDPGSWFDAVADATPRTGAALAQADPAARAAARRRFVELALAEGGVGAGRAELKASAVLIAAVHP